MVQEKQKPVEEKPEADSKSADQNVKPDPKSTLKNIVALLENSVSAKDTRLLMGRLMRQTAALRKDLNVELLTWFLKHYVDSSATSHSYVMQTLGKIPGDVAMDEGAAAEAAGEAPTPSSLPEVELYSCLLLLMFLTDKKMHTQAREAADKAVQRLAEFNRRTLDVIAARIYFYYSLAYELTGELASIRSQLLALHRTATLRHNAIGSETLLNLLLRNYLHYNLYDQAEKFRSKAQKADSFRSGQQYCRYLFYLGTIRTVQLEYSDAKDCLQQAVRKAPGQALGFRTLATKWLILVRLLLGEIPERSEFTQKGLREALQPYAELCYAVRNGDLVAFKSVTEQYAAGFRQDKVHNLLTRLHHNVIRTGLRRINLAYSRISLAEVATKLHLASAEDAECIVAKAIRDGGIDATIDHAGGFIQSRESVDVYSTQEPQQAFHARIAFCLDLHNEATKAMRFDHSEGAKRKLEDADAAKERAAAEAELAEAMDEDDD